MKPNPIASILGFLLMTTGLSAQTLPPLTATSLAGRTVTLPETGKATVLIVGFSQKGGERTKPWAQRFARDFGTDPQIACYSVAVLAGVPSLLQSMVLSFIKNGTPVADRAAMLTTFSDAAAWKTVAAFHDPDDAYVVLVDRQGTIVRTLHEPFTESLYASAAAVVRSQLIPLKKEP